MWNFNTNFSEVYLVGDTLVIGSKDGIRISMKASVGFNFALAIVGVVMPLLKEKINEQQRKEIQKLSDYCNSLGLNTIDE